jgi:hypothetical protein
LRLIASEGHRPDDLKGHFILSMPKMTTKIVHLKNVVKMTFH